MRFRPMFRDLANRPSDDFYVNVYEVVFGSNSQVTGAPWINRHSLPKPEESLGGHQPLYAIHVRRRSGPMAPTRMTFAQWQQHEKFIERGLKKLEGYTDPLAPEPSNPYRIVNGRRTHV